MTRSTSPTVDTPAGASVPCVECGRSITLPRAVPAEEHALSLWTCEGCMEELHPGSAEEARAERAYVAGGCVGPRPRKKGEL